MFEHVKYTVELGADMDIACLLDILGNETRREILQMLTERRCYVSQISSELNVGQKAIIKHLEIMEEAGILEPHFEKIEKGRPRKYFNVSQNLVVEVNLFSGLFDMKIHSPSMEEEILEDFPRIKELALILRDREARDDRYMIDELRIIREELLTEKRRLSELKRVIDFLISKADSSIEDEEVRRRLRKELSVG